jgi:prepilin-type N-terminal cleavage/methylation domain-containing protein
LLGAVAAGNQVNKTELIVTRLLRRSHRANKKESSMRSKSTQKAGFTLVEIMIVVAIIGLLAAIAIPNFLKARATSQQNACINNLRQIDAAKQQWALETGQGPSASPAGTDIQPYLGRGAAGNLQSVVCPLDSTKTFAGSYTMGNMSTTPACSVNGGGSVDSAHPHVLNN